MGSIAKIGDKLYLRYREADGKQRMKLARGCTTRAEAKVMLAEVERRVMLGQLGVPEPVEETPEELRRRTLTVRQLGAHFLGDVEGFPGYVPDLKDREHGGLDAYRRQARSKLDVRIYPVLGDRLASSLRLIDVERLRDALLTGDGKEREPLAPRSVTLTLAVISKMYTWGARAGLVDVANPAKGVSRPKASPSLDYLTAEEVANLLAAAEKRAETDAVIYPLVAAAVFTGMRKGELFGLRWRDVHLDAQRIDVERSYQGLPKSGQVRSLPLHPTLGPILRGWRERCPTTPEALVFPVRGRMATQYETLGLEALMTSAGCHLPADGHVWHLLRHTFASHQVMAGVSLYDVQKLLGHSTPMMTQIYAKLSRDHLLEQVARMTFARPKAGVVDLGERRRKRVAGDARDADVIENDTPPSSTDSKAAATL